MAEPNPTPLSIDDLIHDHLDSIEGDFALPVEAQKFVARCRELRPRQFRKWLEDRAEAIVNDRMRIIEANRRLVSRRRAVPDAFREATEAWEQEEDSLPLSVFRTTHVINDSGDRRRVEDMTAENCLYVAGLYEFASSRNALYGHFQRVVAKKVGPGRCVADVMTEDEYNRLLRSTLAP